MMMVSSGPDFLSEKGTQPPPPRRSAIPATVTWVAKQFHQDGTHQLEPDAIRRACHDLAYQWRQRVLDPVVTMQRFVVQMLHGHTACTPLRHLTQWAVTASAYCQARMRLPLRVFQELRRAVSDH